jgi:transcription termination factor NusB
MNLKRILNKIMIKNKKNFFSRIYIIQLMHVYFHEIGYKNITSDFIDKKIIDEIDITELFEDMFEWSYEDLDKELIEGILVSLVNNYKLINTTRENHQDRKNCSVDNILLIIINVALGEYLFNKNSVKIIISEYVNIASVLHDATKFIHSILDKSLKNLEVIGKE